MTNKDKLATQALTKLATNYPRGIEKNMWQWYAPKLTADDINAILECSCNSFGAFELLVGGNLQCQEALNMVRQEIIENWFAKLKLAKIERDRKAKRAMTAQAAKIRERKAKKRREEKRLQRYKRIDAKREREERALRIDLERRKKAAAKKQALTEKLNAKLTEEQKKLLAKIAAIKA